MVIHQRLDRRTVAYLVPNSKDQVQRDLRDIWLQEVTELMLTNVNQRYVSRAYHTIGRKVLAYTGVDDTISSVSELESKIRRAGSNVAFLTREFRDRGLLDEEGVWFGEVSQITGERLFAPAKCLAQQIPLVLADLTAPEKLNMYISYLLGKEDSFMNGLGFKYGTIEQKSSPQKK